MTDTTVKPEGPKDEPSSKNTLDFLGGTQKALQGAKVEVSIISEVKKKLKELADKFSNMKPAEKIVGVGGLFVPFLLKWILEDKIEKTKKTGAEKKETSKKKKTTDSEEEQEESAKKKPKMRITTKIPLGTKQLKDSEVSKKLKAEAAKFQKEASGKPQGTKKEVAIDGKTYVLQREVHFNRNPKGALGTSAYEKKA